MASELRVNTSTNRVGLGTITYTDTGPIISGITTGNNFKTGSTNVHSTGVELANINTGGGTATFGGTITLSGGNITLADRPDGNNQNLFFGTGAKAAAYHDGTNFTIINNTGHTYIGIGAANKDLMLYAQSTGNIILQRNTGHKYFEGVGSDGTAIIYFNTNEKLRTTNTGVSITGIPVATQTTGNVGLELHATGSGRGSQTKYHNDHGEAYVGQAGDTTGNLLVHNTSNTNIIFATNNTPKVTLDSSGRLQIGASNNTGANTKLVVGVGNNINTTAIINTGDVDVDALTLSNWDGSTTTNKVMMHFDSSGIGGWNIGMPAATDAFVIEDDGGNEKVRINTDSLIIGSNDNDVAKLEIRYSTVPAYITNSYNGSQGESTFSNNIARTSDGSHSWGSFNNTSYGAGAITLLSSTSDSSITFNTASAVNTNPSQRGKIAGDGSTYWGGTVLTESDLNWAHDTNQRPHIFSGNMDSTTTPADGSVVAASPWTNAVGQRIGVFIFGNKTSSTSGVANSGVKAAIECHTNTNPGDAWKAGSRVNILTRPDNGNLTERFLVTSSGDVSISNQAPNSYSNPATSVNTVVQANENRSGVYWLNFNGKVFRAYIKANWLQDRNWVLAAKYFDFQDMPSGSSLWTNDTVINESDFNLYGGLFSKYHAWRYFSFNRLAMQMGNRIPPIMGFSSNQTLYGAFSGGMASNGGGVTANQTWPSLSGTDVRYHTMNNFMGPDFYDVGGSEDRMQSYGLNKWANNSTNSTSGVNRGSEDAFAGHRIDPGGSQSADHALQSESLKGWGLTVEDHHPQINGVDSIARAGAWIGCPLDEGSSTQGNQSSNGGSDSGFGFGWCTGNPGRTGTAGYAEWGNGSQSINTLPAYIWLSID